MSKLVLFDVDGTLVLSGCAGLRAMTRTFEEIFQVQDGFTGISMAGGTDTIILDAAIARLGLEVSPAVRACFHEKYCVRLAQEILLPGPRKGVMPGRRISCASRTRDPSTGTTERGYAWCSRVIGHNEQTR